MLALRALDAVLGWEDQHDRALLSCLEQGGDWAAAGEQLGVPPGLLRARWTNLTAGLQHDDAPGGKAATVQRWSQAEQTVLLHAALHVRARNEELKGRGVKARVLASQLYAAMARFLPGRSAHAVRQTLTSQVQQHDGVLTATGLVQSASEAWQQLLTEWMTLPVAQMDTARRLASQLLEQGALDVAQGAAAPAAAASAPAPAAAAPGGEPGTPSSGDGSSGHLGSDGAAQARLAVRRSASIDAGFSLQHHNEATDARLAQAQQRQAAAQHLHHLPAASAPGPVAPAASSWQPADGSGVLGLHGGRRALSLASSSMLDADVFSGGADATRSCPLPPLSSSWLQQQQERLQATWQAAASQEQTLRQLQAQCRAKQQCAADPAGVGPAAAGHDRRRKAPYPPQHHSGLLPPSAASNASPAAAAAAGSVRRDDARRQPSFSGLAAHWQGERPPPAARSAPLPAVNVGSAAPAAAEGRGLPAVAAEQLQAVQQTMQALEAMVAELTQVVDRMADQQLLPGWGQPPQPLANRRSAPGAARTLSAPLPAAGQGLLQLMEPDDAPLGLSAPQAPGMEQGGLMQLDGAAVEDLLFRQLLEGERGSFNGASAAAAAAVAAAVTAGLESSRSVSASTAALAEAAAASDVWAQGSGVAALGAFLD